jgi:hypothetical protein
VNIEENVEFTTGEVHCYFPEWAERPESAGTASESDHNSYMAGGYAEEFGYFSCVDCPAVFTILDGDAERCSLWGVQMGGLHPGYPECARPLDRIRSGDELAPVQKPHLPGLAEGLPSGKMEVRFTAVPVRRVARSTGTYAVAWWKAWRILRRG